MQEIFKQYTQIYLEAVNKYIHEKAEQGLKKLSKAESAVLTELRILIDNAPSAEECCLRIKNNEADLARKPLFQRLQSAADQFYLEENIHPINESKGLQLQRLQKRLHEEIDFFLIEKAASKKRPEQIGTLRKLILSDVAEEERQKQLTAYLSGLDNLLGKSRLKAYLTEAVTTTRSRYPEDILNQNEDLSFENEGYKKQAAALKHLIQYEREKHKNDLKAERKKHAVELSRVEHQHAAEKSELRQRLKNKQNETRRLEKKIAAQNIRIDEQQIKIEALSSQMQAMITVMQELQCCVAKTQEKIASPSSLFTSRHVE